jgi:hypothetical protein
VDFYLGTVNELVSEVGYIPVPESTLGQETDEWERFRRQA